MARIAGVDLPRKRVEVGADLRLIALIAKKTSARLVSPDEGPGPGGGGVAQIRQYVDANVEVEGDLRRENNQNIRLALQTSALISIRHRRGSRSCETNARSRKWSVKPTSRREEEK